MKSTPCAIWVAPVLFAVVACGSTNQAAQAAQTKSEQSASLSPEQHDVTVDGEGYERLTVSVSVPDENGVVTVQGCPEGSLWDIDVKQILKGDRSTAIGVSLGVPGLSKITLNPVSIQVTPGMPLIGKRKCQITVDQTNFTSPPIYVNGRYNNQNFSVGVAYGYTDVPSQVLVNVATQAANAISALSRIPPPLSSVAGQQIKNDLAQTGIDNKDTEIRDITIKDGAVKSPITFLAESVLPAANGHPARSILLSAEVTAFKSLIQDPPTSPPSPASLTPGYVLGLAFPANSAPGGSNTSSTFEGYLQTADTNLSNYRSAASLALASQDCANLKRTIDQIGLTSRDQALLIWAATHNPRPGAVAEEDIDKMDCLAEAWANYLPAYGLKPHQPPPPPQTPPPAAAVLASASTAQMGQTTRNNDDFADFMTLPGWNTRRIAATNLFAYPAKAGDPSVAFVDADHLVFSVQSPTPVQSPGDWLANINSVNDRLLAKVGCYAFFNAADMPPNLAGTIGKGSLMVAVGELKDQPAPTLQNEVALFVYFAPSDKAAQSARIVEIDVARSFTGDQKTAVRKAIGDGCPSGYSPPMIFQ